MLEDRSSRAEKWKVGVAYSLVAGKDRGCTRNQTQHWMIEHWEPLHHPISPHVSWISSGMWTRTSSKASQIYHTYRLLSSSFRHPRATMSTSLPHEVRTASEPRQRGLYSAILSQITQVNPTIRLLRLSLPSEPRNATLHAQVSLSTLPRSPLHVS